jgi:hypothetical protein
MAHRIDVHVTKGEIDCRVKGRVTGTLTFDGCDKPIVLDLTGNAWPDMAGCVLTFVNRGNTFSMRRDVPFAPVQKGSAGDMTASRKVRVPELPFDEDYEMRKRGEKPPERMANAIYLEWFSENGRVVLESTECEVTLSPPEWRMTREENEQRAKDASDALGGFLDKLTRAIEKAESKVPWDKEEWDEFDHEKMLRESDARTDKYSELLDKYMDHPDRERIVAKEMGWDHILEMLDAEEERKQHGEGGESDDAVEAEATEDAANPAEESESGERKKGWEVPDLSDYEEPEPDPLTEGKDWVRNKHGDIKHPLSNRAFESAMDLWHRMEELGLKDDRDEDLGALVGEFQILSAKLAGALDGLAQERPYIDYAHNIARMKRGLNHLHTAQAALVKVEEKKLLPQEDLDATRTELFAIREEMLRLMDEFRQEREG